MSKFRIASVLISVLIVLSILVGCSGATTTTTPAATTKAAGTTASAQPTTTKAKEVMQISIALWSMEKFDDELSKIVEERNKVKLKTINMTWETYLEQTKLFAASGDMPDCIGSYTTNDISCFYSWINQGIIRTIPETMIAKYSNVKKMYDNYPHAQAIKQLKGAYYYIPRPNSVTNMYQGGIQYLYYRKDWLKNVGITKVPETIDEFYAMLKAFKNNDPDKNGKADTSGLVVEHTPGIGGFFGAWGVYPASWQYENGQWIPGYISKNNIDALKFLQKLYKEGLLDQEYTKNTWKESLQKFSTGAFGVCERNADAVWARNVVNDNFGAANPGITNPLDAVGILPPFKKDAASKPGWLAADNNCGTEISAKVSDEKLDRIMELIDWMLTDEAKSYYRYGIEGKTYKKTNGKIEMLNDPATGKPFNLSTVYPSRRIFVFSDWDQDFNAQIPGNPAIPDNIKTFSNEATKLINAAVLPEKLEVKLLSTPAKDSLMVNFQDEFNKMILSDGDIEKLFNDFVNAALKSGVQQAITEVNAAATKAGIKP